MKRLIEFSLEDGGSILVEVDAPEEAGLVLAARGESMPEKARQSFEAALDKVRPAAPVRRDLHNERHRQALVFHSSPGISVIRTVTVSCACLGKQKAALSANRPPLRRAYNTHRNGPCPK